MDMGEMRASQILNIQYGVKVMQAEFGEFRYLF